MVLEYYHPIKQNTMAQITLDVPQEKLHSFLMMVMQLGIEKTNNVVKQLTSPFTTKKNPTERMHPYFDWDFYSNELEFE
jgi:hypothetical protein